MAISLIPTIAAILVVAAFVRLGVWQLDRAGQKQALISAFDMADTRDQLPLERYRPQSRYQPVEISGQFRMDHVLLLDNQVRDRVTGVHVISPFQPEGGGPLVLVNRGWLPLGPRRELPDVPQRPGRQRITGMLSAMPQPGIRLGEVTLNAQDRVHLVPYIELPPLESLLNSELAPQILLSTADEPGGMIREWRPQTMSPEKHQAYAFQWFSMALAVAIIWGVLTMRGRRRTS